MAEPDSLDRQLTQVYAGKVVRKDLLHQIKGGENVPSYVQEYLLGRYCASDDAEEIRLGIEAVKATLRDNCQWPIESRLSGKSDIAGKSGVRPGFVSFRVFR